MKNLKSKLSISFIHHSKFFDLTVKPSPRVSLRPGPSTSPEDIAGTSSAAPAERKGAQTKEAVSITIQRMQQPAADQEDRQREAPTP